MQDGIWFSYDSALWDASGDAFFPPYLQFKSESDCQVYLNYGHGMSEFFEWTEAAKTIAGFNFVVTEWRYTGTRDIILKAYRLGDDFLFTVENPQATALSERCLNEAEELLKLSAQQGFNPYTQQAPATASVLPPIVYSKEGNIYAYFLDSENILSITKDGGKYMGDIYVRYANPRVSLDGRLSLTKGLTVKVSTSTPLKPASGGRWISICQVIIPATILWAGTGTIGFIFRVSLVCAIAWLTHHRGGHINLMFCVLI